MLEQQQELVNKIKNNLSRLPHSILLTGERGSEFKEICDLISQRFNLEKVVLNEISYEVIDDIVMSNVNRLYVLDANNLNEKDQNTILKLFEDPPICAYIVLCNDGSSMLLDTIINRSYELKLNKYSKEYLSTLVSDKSNEEKILSVCSTPGQINIANHTNIDELFKLCSNMLTSMQKANYQNALSIANKINFKDEYDKFDLYLFISALEYVMLTTGNISLYEDVLVMNKKLLIVNDKRQQFEQFITRVWARTHSLQID